MEAKEDKELFYHDDDQVPTSKEEKVPKWLKTSYWLLLIWGIWALYAFWSGSFGWFDRGSWAELQKAANTTENPINNL